MGYIASEDIHAFPVATRSADFPYSRLTTEYNLTHLVATIADKSGFVLTKSVQAGTTINSATDFEFVVSGYYFLTTISDICTAAGVTADSDSTIYANIQLVKNQVAGTKSQQLKNLKSVEPASSDTDQNSDFTGITFTTSAETGQGWISIPLFDINGTSIVLKEEYSYKFDRSSLDMQWNSL